MALADVQTRVPAAKAGPLALTGWVLFDWAAQPFYTLISTFLFAPYFANVFIGDAVRGQALWGYAAAAAGISVALLSPVLGAIADAKGRLKRWIAVCSILMIAGQAALWFAEPGMAGRVILILAAFLIAEVAAELATAFNNAMMPSLAGPNGLGRLSGMGSAVGYAGGLAALVIMAGLIVTNPETGKTLLGLDPIIALNQAAREGDRLVGPFCALWYAVFVLPFFFFTPDTPARASQAGNAIRQGFASVRGTFAHLRRYRSIAIFLLARMIYVDGMAAVFVFGGIYAAVIFGWQAFQLGLFGIILSIAAAAGAFLGGFLDDKLGAKTVILGALVGLTAGSIGVLSVDASHVLFIVEAAPRAPHSAPFSSLGEQVFILFAILIGLASGPLLAASRSLLARLAPPEHMAEFFGFYAFSGKVTSFAAPLAVAAATQLAGSQRIGMSIVLVFLFAGFFLMLRVKTE